MCFDLALPCLTLSIKGKVTFEMWEKQIPVLIKSKTINNQTKVKVATFSFPRDLQKGTFSGNVNVESPFC